MTAPQQPRMFGARVRRVEDPRFLLGRGRYIEDLSIRGMLDVAFVRSSVAHADIVSIDVEEALRVPGVAAVYTGADMAEMVKPITCDSTFNGWQTSGQPAMVVDRVRFSGEAVAAVVADSRYHAEDGAEAVVVEYEPLPVAASVDAALADDAVPLHDGWTNNLFVRDGMVGGEPDRVFDTAHGTLEFKMSTYRHSGTPLECRGCVAEYDPIVGALTLWSATQIPHLIRSEMAICLGIPENRIRVISPDVGGGFGPKSQLYPEELAVSFLAMKTGRPVRWIEDRQEHMLAACHAREHYHTVKVAYAEDGEIVGLGVDVYVDCGAYSVYPWTAAMEVEMTLMILPGPYRIRHYKCDLYSVATNKSPFGAYRGVARSAACLTIERAMDGVAEALGMDPIDVRMRNLLRPEDFPYSSITGFLYDDASLVESLEAVRQRSGYEELRRRQAEARKDGRYLGIGVATYIEQTAPPIDKGLPINIRMESAIVRMDPSASVTVQLGTHSQGQGHETTIAQIVADELEIPMRDIRVLYGDTQSSAQGIGTFASRSAVQGGSAAHIAAGKVRERLLERGAHLLEAGVEDLELREGSVQVRGVPARAIPLPDLARMTYYRTEMFPDGTDPLLEAAATFDAFAGTYANASQIALVEVDPETGRVEILEYHVVEDCGRMINPTIVDGQVHGGIAQGIGGALLEELIYDDEGQLVTASFMDYLVPGSLDVPHISVTHLETPSKITPNGVKGVGEGGAIAPYAVLAGAVEDALRPLGRVFVNEVPLTPGRVRAFVEQAIEAEGVARG
jgi:carbon-monoxide dehydrogenase large subunit